MLRYKLNPCKLPQFFHKRKPKYKHAYPRWNKQLNSLKTPTNFLQNRPKSFGSKTIQQDLKNKSLVLTNFGISFPKRLTKKVYLKQRLKNGRETRVILKHSLKR